MHAIRTSSTLARLILAWFMLTLCVAGASQLVHPTAMELVCSAEGSVKLVAVDEDGEASRLGPHTLDCSLCLAPTLPLPRASVVIELPQPLAHALTPLVAAHIAALVGAPLPPRGPPQYT